MWPDYNFPVKVLYSDKNINLTNIQFNFQYKFQFIQWGNEPNPKFWPKSQDTTVNYWYIH